MSRRIILAAVVASLAQIPIGHAENAPAKEDPLKKLLEEKYQPKPGDKPETFDQKDFHQITPKPNTPSQPNSGQPRRGGQLVPAGSLSFALSYSATNESPRSLLYRVADNRPLPASGSFIVAQQGQPPAGALASVYLIQLKPTATPEQVAALFSKYNLRPIEGGVPALHILRVRGPEVVLGPNQNVFTQKTLTDLRREPVVLSAAVDTTIAPRSVPRAATTTINTGEANYVWSWQPSKPPAPTPNDLSSSTTAKQLDGNWGLKAIRMPPVWTVLQRYRAANPNAARPKIAVFDTGFSKHEDLVFNVLRNPTDTSAPADATLSVAQPCESGHGNHVSGIIGATFGNGLGIDGIVPQAKLDAIVVLTPEKLIQDATLTATIAETRIMLFGNVLPVIFSYVFDSVNNSDLRVVNLSLGYNTGDVSSVPGLPANIAQQAIMFASVARLFEDRVLFVVAAGNDSDGRTTPLDAKWSSPMVWSVTESKLADGPLKNVIVVDASNRFGERAAFSNLSKRTAVSAPGVDIMSTLLPGDMPYAACPGTSQAAPHVAGVAALLFELDPTKKPSEIADIIISTATKPSKAPGVKTLPLSPRLDALEAVLKLSPSNLTRLADLNGDGKVDIEDMKIFMAQMAMINDNRTNGTAFTVDLNGDGVVDPNECSWPMIDLNGSGRASLALADAKLVQGQYRTDLDVIGLAWTDKVKDFKTALKETGLDVALQSADVPATGPLAVSAQACLQ